MPELNFKLAWDDSETLGRFALQPWVNFAMETHKTSFGVNKGEGLQMGIEPTLFEVQIENYPITVTAPVELGLTIDDYYERAANGHESTFGYLSYGLKASVPRGRGQHRRRVLIGPRLRLSSRGGAGAPRPAPSSPRARRPEPRRAAVGRPPGSRSARRRPGRAGRSEARLPGRPDPCR